MRLCSVVCLVALALLTRVVSADDDLSAEFDIKPDFSIDAPPIGGIQLVGSGVPSPNQPSLGPQPQYVNHDLSGWGIAGKLHPNILIKDKLVRAYHNRKLDPRYAHLKGYGRLDKPQQEPKKPSFIQGLFSL